MGLLSENAALVKNMMVYAHKLYALRYEMSNGGNLSIRLPGKDLMLVKGTNVAFDELSEENVVVADFDGNVVEGKIKASKEALLHGALYRALPDVNAIMHCHSPFATAWAADHEELEFATHHAEMKLSRCPVLDTHSYVVPSSYFPQIVEAFRANPAMKSFLLRAHGQVTVGKDIRSASYLAELVEETAEIAILSQSLGRTKQAP